MKKHDRLRRLLLAMLAVCCLQWGAVGQLTARAQDAAPRYGKTANKGVNVRKKPTAKADVVTKLPITGTLLEITGEEADAAGTAWYAVMAGKETGYIRGALVSEITRAEYDAAMQATKPKASAKGSSKLAAAVQPNPNPAQSSAHPGYAGSTPVWVEAGIYHSDLACPRAGNGSQTTLQAAQGQGLSPCSLCWCYECLYGEE